MIKHTVRLILCVLLLSSGSFPAVAQEANKKTQQNLIQVTGTVKDELGEPLLGASVVLNENGTKKGVVTNEEGKFQMNGVRPGAKLTISCMGMLPQTVSARATLNITLEEDKKQLDELLVVSFGQQTKASFTGSAGVVGSEDIAKKQATNVIGAIQGEIAGVQMTNNSGDPTAEPTIRIRGISSINAGNDPLIILDGAPYDGGFNSINPADVASVTVLKDAASNALYGARGANGVILITTKSAARGESKTDISFDAKWGVNKEATVDYDYVRNPGAYYEMYYQALRNYYLDNGMSNYDAHINANQNLGANATVGGLGYMSYSVPNGELLVGENGRLNPNARPGNRIYNNGQFYTITPDNWLDAAYRTALRQEYSLSISTSTDKARLYASLGYLGNEGVAVNTMLDRYTARLKGDWQAKKWLSVSGNVGYTHNTSTAITDESTSYNIFYSLRRMAPIYPLYIRDGSGRIMSDSNGLLYDYGDATHHGLNRPELGQTNLIQESMLNTNKTNDNQMTLNGSADITPCKGLKLTLNGTVATTYYKNVSTTNSFYGSGASAFDNGFVGATAGNSLSLNFQQLLSYNFSFGNNNFNLLAGHENYKNSDNYLYGYKQNMASYYENQTLAGAIKVYSTSETASEYSNEGYFFRGMYDYNERYFASFSYRRDASSRFHADHRWGNFYSAGAAWIISRENWFKGAREHGVDMLKLKASVGQMGNDRIGDYRYTDLYSIVNNAGVLGLQFYSKGNPNITWETNTNINAGLEFELLKGRLTGSVEYFHRRTTDMLFFLNVPKSAGYSGYYDNIGDMDNYGVELDLSAALVKKRNVTWSVNLNATHYKNKILRLADEVKNTTIANGMRGRTGSYSGQYLLEGKSIYTWCLPKYAGVNENGLSQWYLADGTPTTDYSAASTAKNLQICGDAIPDLYGGFGTKLSLYGVDLSVTFNYSIGGDSYDYAYAQAMTNPTSNVTGYNIHKDMYNAWSPTNTGSDIPRWMYGDNNTTSMSSRFLTDASYLTLQNVNIGYTLPTKWTRKVSISSVRLYAAADNLCYVSQRKGFDPRGSFHGSFQGNSYSPVRSISGGLTVTF